MHVQAPSSFISSSVQVNSDKSAWSTMSAFLHRCPFLKSVPWTGWRKACLPLLSLADRCPIVTRQASTPPTQRAAYNGYSGTLPLSEGSQTTSCPFVSSQINVVKASPEVQEDVSPTKKVSSPFKGLRNIIVDKILQVATPTPSHLLKDNMADQSFDYDGFFDGKIQDKKMDHTYRVFKTVNRRVDIFPFAEDYSTADNRGAEVSVWCSNDYLGMSRHPQVLKSIQ
ncbi:hypothetical protein AGOR_G00080630 [Albula goreensis]|uniref:5-aminolevulinate synthase presequence domain-containing protein n=1 Tax=Albula goreensis TaxID=1534307 RepID=A0A8T3DPF6_9TELE|nr:hypothetical protein AGOR_G00080630 [Albula goreensis]